MKQYDIILISPDAFVDHPSFAHAILKRNLESKGFSVAVIDRPKWQENDYFRYGKPRLFWAVSGGNVDSLVMNYTPSGRKRKTDEYQEKGNPYFPDMPQGEKSRIRPDRCITVYVNGIKSRDRETPIVIGGIEAGMRRFAHYDFLSDRVRSSILVDCGADILVYGMGENTLIAIAESVKSGKSIKSLQLRGTCRLMQKGETVEGIEIPSFDLVREDKEAFVKMTELIFTHSASHNSGNILIQKHAGRAVLQFPPPPAFTENEMDFIYSHDFSYGSHRSEIPALRMVQESVITHRGCFGGCSFCALTLHQGKKIQSRSIRSIENEILRRSQLPGFTRTIRDLGGPSADMYGIICNNEKCTRESCLSPSICPVINNKPLPALDLYKRIFAMKAKNNQPLLKHLFIGSGIRHDLTVGDKDYFRYLASRCVSGYLKAAPEHAAEKVLMLMKKPPVSVFEKFLQDFNAYSREAGKNQFVIPYLLIGHPGETMEDVLALKDFLLKHRLRVEQVQIFTPTPMTQSTCMYYTGIVPFSREKIPVCRDMKELEKRKEIVLKAGSGKESR